MKLRRTLLAGSAALAMCLVPGASYARTPTAAAPVGRLSNAAPCPDQTGFTCATLTVPLDHRHDGRTHRTIGLKVAMSDNTAAPKGDLVFLTGGPGQPGVPFAARMAEKLAPVLKDYRLVLLDQRGTGDNALQCPQLQEQMGSSDLTPPTADAVTACGAAVGPDRQFYGTDATVADLDLLRSALHTRRLTLDGVSYGTYVAERYTLRYPQHVSRLVLDSVVPQTDYDPMDRAAMRAVPRVLTASCRAIGCTTDPAGDLAKVVETYQDGALVLDMLTTWEFVDPNYAQPITALHQAAAGDPGMLNGLIQGAHQGGAATAEELSQGLHTSTLCLDGVYPWGRSNAPLAGRADSLAKAGADLTPADYGPFDAQTATGLGSMLACLNWPRTPVEQLPSPHRKLQVPVLLLGGDRDLSTPLEWLYDERRLAPRAQVVVVPGASHSIQSRATGGAGLQAVYNFLAKS